ncbi:hypothetical protein HMI54_001468 [Coelomomyces lativittatus]|nr:hypothetical protein HMI54_001468 [Coelomomyces lativittatus]
MSKDTLNINIRTYNNRIFIVIVGTPRVPFSFFPLSTPGSLPVPPSAPGSQPVPLSAPGSQPALLPTPGPHPVLILFYNRSSIRPVTFSDR